MKRRDFLKYCSSLPFIGTLFNQSNAEATIVEKSDKSQHFEHTIPLGESVVTFLRNKVIQTQNKGLRVTYVILGKYEWEHLLSWDGSWRRGQMYYWLLFSGPKCCYDKWTFTTYTCSEKKRQCTFVCRRWEHDFIRNHYEA